MGRLAVDVGFVHAQSVLALDVPFLMSLVEPWAFCILHMFISPLQLSPAPPVLRCTGGCGSGGVGQGGGGSLSLQDLLHPAQ